MGIVSLVMASSFVVMETFCGARVTFVLAAQCQPVFCLDFALFLLEPLHQKMNQNWTKSRYLTLHRVVDSFDVSELAYVHLHRKNYQSLERNPRSCCFQIDCVSASVPSFLMLERDFACVIFAVVDCVYGWKCSFCVVTDCVVSVGSQHVVLERVTF